jgi:hypothetical protein
MNQSKLNQTLFAQNSLSAKELKQIDELNKSASSNYGVSKTHLLLVTLSTTVMLASKKPLPKEYYQWTRIYLDKIRNDDGTNLANVGGLLRHIDWFEKENQIDDEFQYMVEEIPSDEKIEIIVPEQEQEEPGDPLLNSTAIFGKSKSIDENLIRLSSVSDNQVNEKDKAD